MFPVGGNILKADIYSRFLEKELPLPTLWRGVHLFVFVFNFFPGAFAFRLASLQFVVVQDQSLRLVRSSGVRVQGLWFRIYGSGFRVQG